jgi:hypothetical protein
VSAPRFQSVHIVTYGRSGSTLLMGLLNTIDGYLVRGENNQCLDHLRRFYRQLERTRHRQKPDATRPWYNEIDGEDALERLRELYRAMLTGNRDVRVFGFKEIRYPELGRKDLFDLLDFLDLLAPPAAIVHLTRAAHEVAQSRWWATLRPWEVRRQLRRFERRMRVYAARSPERCFHLDYADMVGRTPRLRELFEFLGEPFDEEAVARVLATPHSY